MKERRNDIIEKQEITLKLYSPLTGEGQNKNRKTVSFPLGRTIRLKTTEIQEVT